MDAGLDFYNPSLLNVTTYYKKTGLRHKNPIEVDRIILSVFTGNLISNSLLLY